MHRKEKTRVEKELGVKKDGVGVKAIQCENNTDV